MNAEVTWALAAGVFRHKQDSMDVAAPSTELRVPTGRN